VGHPEWREDRRFLTNADRNANWATMLCLVEEWTSQRSSAEAEEILSRYGVPCGRYREMDEVLADPQLAARGAMSPVNDGAGSYLVPNPPFTMSGSRVQVRPFVSELGEHGAAVLQEELGLSEETVAALRGSNQLL
jgi:crotonobetainyl-CoA:carnitine CoA-transferase CaiB-like acyl-CoA transferase